MGVGAIVGVSITRKNIYMKLFSIKSNKLAPIDEAPFKLEKHLQKLVEANIQSMFNGLQFVKTEFSLSGQHKDLRIDTLAFDVSGRSFVIIEYKRGKNFSVIDQGYGYLSAMLNKQADFVLAYNNKFKTNYGIADINWKESKVYFIAPDFTPMQLESVSFKDLPILLWEAKKYKNSLLTLNRVGVAAGSAQIANISSKGKKSNSVQSQIRAYTENDLLLKSKEPIKELYFDLKSGILNLANFEVKITKLYAAFLLDGSNFVDVEPFGKSLKVFLNVAKGKLNDPNKMARDISNIGHHGNGDYQVVLKDSEKLDKILDLIKQNLPA